MYFTDEEMEALREAALDYTDHKEDWNSGFVTTEPILLSFLNVIFKMCVIFLYIHFLGRGSIDVTRFLKGSLLKKKMSENH